ncbi:hypothetical protein AMATHDRAFT_67211, partial [Amanita thiersii Skay4041]
MFVWMTVLASAQLDLSSHYLAIMSLLCNLPTSTVSPYILKEGEERQYEDYVSMSRSLWRVFVRDAEPSRVCLCLQPTWMLHGANSGLICWAVPDDQIEHIAIPSSWPRTYRHIFGVERDDPLVHVTLHDPIPLQEVVLTALSESAYKLAQVSSSSLEAWFASDKRILRCGATYGLDSLDGFTGHDDVEIPLKDICGYRLDVAAPALQGYAVTGSTNFIVISAATGEEVARSPDSDELGVDPDSIVINEEFLKSCIPLIPSADVSPHSSGEREVVNNRFRPVSCPDNATQGADDKTLFIRTADLGSMGLLDGDWIVAGHDKYTRRRLVRIQANDEMLETTGLVAGSASLLHNICADRSRATWFTKSTESAVVLYCSHSGIREPIIPTARAVTVARVASPVSNSKAYQQLVLQSLKKYFETGKRLVKQGDLIRLSIDTDFVHLATQVEANMENSEEAKPSGVAGYSHPSAGPRANEVLFFRVTDVDYGDRPPDLAATVPDLYAGCTTGELGCWVDPGTTRVLQAGLEQSYVAANMDFSGSQSSSQVLPLVGDSKLLQLGAAAVSGSAAQYDFHISVLLKGARGIGKFTTASWVAQRLGFHLIEVDCFEICAEGDTKMEALVRLRFEQASQFAPCLLVLRHIEALAQKSQTPESRKEHMWSKILQECFGNVAENWKKSGLPTMIVGTTSEPGKVPVPVLSCFKNEINFTAPNDKQRREILGYLLANVALSPDVSLDHLASETAALVASDLVNLVTRAKLCSIRRSKTDTSDSSGVDTSFIPLTSADFNIALKDARTAYSENIGAPKIPSVSWDDVGGLADVKQDIFDTIQLPMDHPELFSKGLKKRSGILLYGPPGTGKTLVAKAIATSFSLNFLSVKGPELLNMYIGESEANVRRIFQRARDATPCVIFFDELDSIAPKRGNHGDSAGVMDRIVSQLLAELDGMASSSEVTVFVIGATNRPDLLDPALLRPGRFDRALYLGVSQTHLEQLNILEALTRKFRLDPTLDLLQIAQSCPFNYTGADFYALCSDAMLNAMSRKAEELEHTIDELNKHPLSDKQHPYPITAQYYLAEMAQPHELEVIVKSVDFELALNNLIPSVSQSEMEHYASLKELFSSLGSS